jgi:hypothetical protein
MKFFKDIFLYHGNRDFAMKALQSKVILFQSSQKRRDFSMKFLIENFQRHLFLRVSSTEKKIFLIKYFINY